jgi:hypothetical protein
VQRFVIGTVIVLAMAFVSLYCGMRKYGSWALDPSNEVTKQEARHLVCGSDRSWRIDPSRLPIELRNALPIVQKWSMTDATILLDCFKKAGDAELEQVIAIATQLADPTRAFLASGVAPNADEASAFRNFQDVAILARRVLVDRDKRRM